MLIAASTVFIILFAVLFWFIHSAKSFSEIHAPLILEQRNKLLGNPMFEHYFLANKGTFVIGVKHRPSTLMFSAAYSFSGLIALIFAALNFYYSNYIIFGIMLLIVADVHLSSTGIWFPHKDLQICFERTIINWGNAYPADVRENNPNGSPSWGTLRMFFETAISISEKYFFGERP